jgi:hypothetical protein
VATKKKSSAAQKKLAENRFLSAVKTAAKEHPEGARAFGIARVAAKTAGKTPRCVLWGIDPLTGERICLKYADECGPHARPLRSSSGWQSE